MKSCEIVGESRVVREVTEFVQSFAYVTTCGVLVGGHELRMERRILRENAFENRVISPVDGNWQISNNLLPALLGMAVSLQVSPAVL